MLHQPCITEMKSTWSWCITLYVYCWVVITKILLRFCIYVNEGYWCVAFFSCNVFGWGMSNAGLIKWFGKYSFLFNFLEVCVELVMFLPHMLGKIHQWSHLSLCGKASNYKLNFPQKYRVFRLRISFLSELWKLVSFKKSFHFNVLNLSGYICS